MKTKILLAWSGGKDSAMTLYELRRDPTIEIQALLTTITKDYDRISMHGVRTELLDEQAESVGLPLEKVFISVGCTNEEYGAAMRQAMEKHVAQGVTAVAFGDLFLQDIREYREAALAQVGIRGLFPLWQRDTAELARSFIYLGFKAVVTCADSQQGTAAFAGRDYDESLLADLPSTADPCFENGECHTFVWDGPIFSWPVKIEKGEIVLRDDRFVFCDLLRSRS